MTSRENIERWVAELNEDGMCDISDNQVAALIRDYNSMAVQLANAESKCRELAAESVTVKECASDVMRHVYRSKTYLDSSRVVDAIQGLQCAIERKVGKAPATDAFLAEVRAQGVDMFALMFAEEAIKSNNITTGWRAKASRAASEYAEALREDAAQLRKGAAL